MGKGSLDLQVHPLVRLSEYMASLRMTELHDLEVQFLQHERGDLAGELTLILPAHVLGAEPDEVLVDLFGRAVKRSKGRNDKHLIPASVQIRRELLKLCQVFHRIVNIFVHFQIGSKIQLFHINLQFFLSCGSSVCFKDPRMPCQELRRSSAFPSSRPPAFRLQGCIFRTARSQACSCSGTSHRWYLLPRRGLRHCRYGRL